MHAETLADGCWPWSLVVLEDKIFVVLGPGLGLGAQVFGPVLTLICDTVDWSYTYFQTADESSIFLPISRDVDLDLRCP